MSRELEPKALQGSKKFRMKTEKLSGQMQVGMEPYLTGRGVHGGCTCTLALAKGGGTVVDSCL